MYSVFFQNKSEKFVNLNGKKLSKLKIKGIDSLPQTLIF